MMKRVPIVAVAAFVLSATGAFAEPPNSVTSNDGPATRERVLGQVADADMAALRGKGLRSGACTLAVKGAGYVLFGVATMFRDPFGQGIGVGLVGAAGAICA